MNTPLSDLLNLTGKVAIVTGSAMGIGKGIALRLHEAGAKMVIADFNEEAAVATAAELNALRPDSALAIKTDVSQSADITNLIAKTVETFGSVDIFVNNAGIYPFKTLADMTEDDFMKVINVNLRGAFLCTKMASDQMIKQGKGGKIINVTSIDALHPSMIGLAHYDSSKHGLWGFTKNIALELAAHKIWVNAIAPGGIATPGASGGDKATTDAFTAKIPMHRMGEADDIGKVALFLASDLASYMTGEQIVVDGGALLG
jgi:2-dehydro-3-deoxy-D-gluconate 5-dehydrogenase